MKFILLSALLLTTYILFAQTEMPEFGQFDGNDLAIKQCDFDKEADAIVLFDFGRSDYNDAYNLITFRRIRFKILKEKGIEHANIEIPFRSKDNFENVYNIQAISYTRSDNGEITIKELDKKSIFTQKVNDNYSLIKFAIPNAKVGTLIDYQYDIHANNYGGLDDWYFQTGMPAVLSRFDLTMIPTAEFTYVVHKSPDIPISVKNDKSAARVIFEMKNIAGLRYEPFMDAAKDYLQHVEFQFLGYVNAFKSEVKVMTTWKSAAQELLGAYYFGKNIDKNLPNDDAVLAQANTFSTPYEKMKYIYEYVRDNFTWNHINSKYADNGIKSAWSNKKGTSSEINFILITLLNKAGLDVDPLLVSERDNGQVSTNIPIMDQFNKVVAYTTIGNKKFVLDATVETPLNIIPFDLLNTNAFIVNNKSAGIVALTDQHSAADFINVYSTIDKSGAVNGYTNINSYNYAKVKRLEDYRESKENFEKDYFEKDYGEIKLDSFEVSNTKTDSLPFQQQFVFSFPQTISGDYKLISTNLFTGLEKNPFTLDNRFTNVDFGCIKNIDVNETFELPANLKPEEIPKNVKFSSPDNTITFIRIAQLNDNVITIQMSLKINKTLYLVEDYPLLKEFYKKMFNILGEQIVLSNN